MTKDAIAAFAEHVVATQFDDMPASTIAAAKVFILDTIGVGLVGSSGPMAAELADVQERFGSGEAARVWSLGKRLPAPAAAIGSARSDSR